VYQRVRHLKISGVPIIRKKVGKRMRGSQLLTKIVRDEGPFPRLEKPKMKAITLNLVTGLMIGALSIMLYIMLGVALGAINPNSQDMASRAVRATLQTITKAQ
jgi:hypothetical protein